MPGRKGKKPMFPITPLMFFLNHWLWIKAIKPLLLFFPEQALMAQKGANLVKENGGTVVVQDPLTAEFDGMPNSAIALGDVDLILPPEIIADELIEYLKESPLTKTFNTLNRQEEAILADVMDLIFRVTSHDFSHYKRPTINRRLQNEWPNAAITVYSNTTIS
jgi:hypothetical protein